jgi:signal transduction histidine kinase
VFKTLYSQFYILIIALNIYASPISANLPSIREDSLKVEEMIIWATYNLVNIDSSICVSMEAYKISKKLNIQTLKFKTRMLLAQCYENMNDTLNAARLYHTLKNEIDSFGTPQQFIEFYTPYAWYIGSQGELEKSLSLFKACLIKSKSYNNYHLPWIYYYLSTTEFNAGHYESSLSNSLIALSLIPSTDKKNQLNIKQQIGLLYLELKIYDKSKMYYTQVLKIARETERPITDALYGLGMCEFRLKNYTEAYLHFNSLVDDIKDNWNAYYAPTNAYLHMWKCMLLLNIGEPEKIGLTFLEKTRGQLNIKRTAYIGVMQAEILLYYNRLDEAEAILRKSMMLINDLEVSSLSTDYYYWMSLVLEKQMKHAEALVYFKKYHDLDDSNRNNNVLNRIASLQEKYNAAEKDKEIIGLNSKLEKQKLEKSLMKSRLYLLSIIIGVVIISILLGIFFFRNRQKYKLLKVKAIYDQKEFDFQQIIKKSKINILQSNIQGQENERNRLAKELHDDLGSRLSALKYFVNSKKGVFKGEDYEVLKEELKEVQEYIRNLSHQIVIPRFTQVSLPHLIREQKNWTNNTNVDFCFEFDEKIDWTLVSEKGQNQIYRIIQEAVNNSLKHSQATEISISSFLNTDKIDFEISDNGTGFELSATHGMGLKNMKERAQLLGSEIRICLVESKGTKISFSYVLN